jgi:UDP-N-acetylmuramoyl-tripeptide--D-alanyl-D-alanine ligase
MNISLKDIAQMCKGKLSKGSNENLLVKKIVKDNREDLKDALFIAIKGAKFDGHNFIVEVLSNGAIAALSAKKIERPNIIYVDNTEIALLELAHNYRKLFKIPVVAITGSNGKTTVKNMLNSICCDQYGIEAIHATTGNLNNYIGMPLTLLAIEPKHKIAIIEIGISVPDEMLVLSQTANPTLAVVNNANLNHAQFFKNVEHIASEKGQIYRGITDKHGVALINQLSPFASMWSKNVVGIKQVKYGLEGSLCYLKYYDANGKIVIGTNYGDIECQLKLLGEHNYYNALTATALALELNCNLKHIKAGLEQYTGYKSRLERKKAFNGALIIDDTYNASLESVKAAIKTIENLPKPHWFIFGDCLDLGEFSQDVHEKIAQVANLSKIDCLITVGKASNFTHNKFNGNKLHFNHNQDIVKYCKENLPANATLLVKGSHSMNLIEIVDKLIQ